MLQYLPIAYQNNPVTKWLWAYLVDFDTKLSIKLEQLLIDYLDIDNATTNGLDFIANINGLDKLFWDTKWTVAQKRMLLKNYRKIVTEMGNKDFINWLFTVFGLNAKLTEIGGWILGVSTFPMTLGGSVFNFTIKIDPSYVAGTQQRELIERIKNTFVIEFTDVTITY
jgi:hypothetical protein